MSPYPHPAPATASGGPLAAERPDPCIKPLQCQAGPAGPAGGCGTEIPVDPLMVLRAVRRCFTEEMLVAKLRTLLNAKRTYINKRGEEREMEDYPTQLKAVKLLMEYAERCPALRKEPPPERPAKMAWEENLRVLKHHESYRKETMEYFRAQISQAEAIEAEEQAKEAAKREAEELRLKDWDLERAREIEEEAEEEDRESEDVEDEGGGECESAGASPEISAVVSRAGNRGKRPNERTRAAQTTPPPPKEKEWACGNFGEQPAEHPGNVIRLKPGQEMDLIRHIHRELEFYGYGSRTDMVVDIYHDLDGDGLREDVVVQLAGEPPEVTFCARRQDCVVNKTLRGKLYNLIDLRNTRKYPP